jgi:adenylate cyclase
MALASLMVLPASKERDEAELAIRLGLGGALQKTRGFIGDELVETNYARTKELSQQVGSRQQHLAALFVQWRYFIWQSRFQTSRDLAEQLLEDAEGTQEPLDLMLANYALGATMLLQGEVEAAYRHLEVTADIYSPRLGATIPYRLGHDPRVTRLSATSWAQWMRGFPAKSMDASLEAVAIADELQDPFTLAVAIDMAALSCEFSRQYERMDHHIDRAQEIAGEHGFANWAALARMHQGSLLVHREDFETGIAELQDGIEAYKATRQTLFLSYYLCRLAECNLLAGRLDDARRELESALAFSERTGERWWDAEIHRLKGKIAAENAADIDSAQVCFQRAIETARAQGARSLELRSAIALARLWRDQDRTAAVDLLAPIYGWFAEGFDTPDLAEAKSLLVAPLNDVGQGRLRFPRNWSELALDRGAGVL